MVGVSQVDSMKIFYKKVLFDKILFIYKDAICCP